MKSRVLIIIGIFLTIFGTDGILFLDSMMPECKGFAAMGLFVFVMMGLDSRAILSNLDCFSSFSGQIVGSTIFAIGLSMMIHVMVKKLKNNIQNKQRIGFTE